MYEEQMSKKREEAAQNNAALAIQQCWREHRQRSEETAAQVQNTAAAQAAARAAIAAASLVAPADDEKDVAVAAPTTESMLDDYRRLLNEREELLDRDLASQRVLATHLAEQRTRKLEAEAGPLTTPELEQQYWSSVRHLIAEKAAVAATRATAEAALEEQRQEFQGTVDESLMQEDNFRQFIRETCAQAPFMRSHKTTIPAAEVDAFLQADEDLRSRIQAARIRYIQLRNFEKKLKRCASATDPRQSEGMYLIDFEQLKIENTNLNEKIEERNEDLVKLRRKVTTTIHVLAHVKEKLEFVRSENNQLRKHVGSTEGELNGVRDQLAQTKKRRDGYLRSNAKMRERAPLVGSEDLLLDYEQRKADINDARIKIMELTEKHQKLQELIASRQPEVDSLRKALTQYPV